MKPKRSDITLEDLTTTEAKYHIFRLKLKLENGDYATKDVELVRGFTQEGYDRWINAGKDALMRAAQSDISKL